MLAIVQTDEEAMHTALYDAIAAMEQRRLSPVNAVEAIALGGRSWSANVNSGNHREVRLNLASGKRENNARHPTRPNNVQLLTDAYP